MLSTIQSGRSGMWAQQLQMATVGNNIANINTTGFKKDRIVFSELVRQKIGHTGKPVLPDTNIVPEVSNGVKVASLDKVFNQGMLKATERSLDVAIDGAGFLGLVAPDGGTLYTRDGMFSRTKDGYLVNAAGYKLPGVKLSEDVQEILIGTDGKITGINSAGEQEQIDAQIMLHRFENPTGLMSIGQNMFKQTEDAGLKLTGHPASGNFGEIRQNHLERSNVDLTAAMVQMITAQRAYAFNSRAIRTADEMWGMANNIRQ
ncbi:MAG: flagellar hook-basal body complex protein [Desulfotomaculum sp.]|nr:flagellar hook-basal body complex protein [Desulfotomaculum sp.]